jgi:DNA polymerase-3 subunit delta'
MATKPLLHPKTQSDLDSYLAQPSHAMILIGQPGIGKGYIADYIAAALFDIPLTRLQNHVALHRIIPSKERSISIDAVRNLEHFMSLRMAGNTRRLAIIEDAHYLTLEAQNALLKTLEEPPEDTFMILTASSDQLLLPTIRSRSIMLHVQRPTAEQLTTYLSDIGYKGASIKQGLLMSGGLPGLALAILRGDETHSLVSAAGTARVLLQSSSFERLAIVDQLAKQRDTLIEVLGMLQQMAHVALAQTTATSSAQARTWHKVLKASYIAHEALLANTQTKLVLTDLMLNL